MEAVPAGEIEHVQRVQSTWRLELRAEPSEVRRARSSAADFARRHHLDGLTDALVLVTSELVSNAVRHAERVVTVELVEHDEHVTVFVADDGPGTPIRADPEPGSESGRGLLIVEGLASRWGTAPTVDGKTVWADLVS
jgi:anti-sigma regulatory factor (Ser/Thr protein kinase)